MLKPNVWTNKSSKVNCTKTSILCLVCFSAWANQRCVQQEPLSKDLNYS